MRRFCGAVVGLLVFVAVAAGAEEPGAAVSVQLDVDPLEATVGDRIEVRLAVRLAPETRLDPPQIGPSLGPFSVVGGSWSGPESDEEGLGWTWTGTIVSFRTGELEIPPIRIRVEGQDGSVSVAESEPRQVRIGSVLAPEDLEASDPPPLADIKPPASLEADYRALVSALGILVLLLIAAGVLWWLHRRYGQRLTAVTPPDDPFHRTPPDVWVYAELQKLLERRLAEEGRVELFFAELSRILKRYLAGRYRVELMERTTAEVPDRLNQAGADAEATRAVAALLQSCDLVKFARREPGLAACREAIEETYRIVDATKPRPAAAASDERGAA